MSRPPLYPYTTLFRSMQIGDGFLERQGADRKPVAGHHDGNGEHDHQSGEPGQAAATPFGIAVEGGEQTRHVGSPGSSHGAAGPETGAARFRYTAQISPSDQRPARQGPIMETRSKIGRASCRERGEITESERSRTA